MKPRYIFVLVFIAACTCGSAAAKEEAFLQYRPPVSLPFGIVQAQALADARRNVIYGSCGMCVFRKKEGAVWTFVLSRFFPDDWTRDRSQGTTKGTARLFILGSKEGGVFVIHYTYIEKDGRFTLDSVDTSAFNSPQERRSSRHRQLRGAGAPLRV